MTRDVVSKERGAQVVAKLLGDRDEQHASSTSIGQYADGTLDAASRGDLAQHFQTCEACRDLLEAAQSKL